MLLLLSVKFHKKIALFMISLLSFELVIAERIGYYSGGPVSYRFAGAALLPGNQWQFGQVRDNYRAAADPLISASPVYTQPLRNEPEVVKQKSDDPFIGGPGQPEMSSFQSANANNMVDLFSGDFSYNIPLLDVGGYPVNISYRSGVSMDEEASWVGLGWNINPGSVTRNMRGVPDDFNGGADTIRKTSNMRANNTLGVNVGGNFELQGLPLPVSLGPSVGLFHTTYNGWGIETALNASINAGSKSKGPLSGGLSITNNSQNGLTINPSLSANVKVKNASDNGTSAFGLQLSAPYNSRTGLKEISLGMNVKAYSKNNNELSANNSVGSMSFAWPTHNPIITIPMTNYNFSFTVKTGGAIFGFHPNLYITGYGGKEYIASEDRSLALPVFGYLNFQNIGSNWASLTDYNREKEIPYREKPAIPHIAVPSYTYDVFSVSGEGTGGSFRAYRGDVGFIADHLIRSKTISGRASIDIGGGNLVHGGTDLNANYSVTQTGPWLAENTIRKTLAFRQNNELFEASYFRNPGEKSINSTAFYDALGGDDVVAPALYQSSSSSPTILATNQLVRYRGKKEVGTIPLNPQTAVRTTRDKRSQLISYLTATEASLVGTSKQIERYAVNTFGLRECEDHSTEDAVGRGTGIPGHYFRNEGVYGDYRIRNDNNIAFDWGKGRPIPDFEKDNSFSVRWAGRVRAPETGTYQFGILHDDGVRVWVNDSVVLDKWAFVGGQWDHFQLNLVKDKLYKIKVEYWEAGGKAYVNLAWRKPSSTTTGNWNTSEKIETEFLYPPAVYVDSNAVNHFLTREDRVNAFRKGSHISEIDVLNADGRRYVYGIPVYNLQQKEVSFSVENNGSNADQETGLIQYDQGSDNTPGNTKGKDGYFSQEEIPAYAHSFLLTNILSPDYVDITNNGISDDDIGDAVKFNYSRTSGIANPYQWRAPYVTGKANYNEGLRSYNRDDKANYITGKKELWYLHSIESKTMIATFFLQPRKDLLEIDENGNKLVTNKAFSLRKIELYTKAEFMERGQANARPIKTVNFEYSYELCRGINQPLNDSGKLTLKRIWFTYNGNNKGKLNPYIFNYHANNPRFVTNATDKWGTYKSPAQNPGATSTNKINNAEYPYPLQDSSLASYNVGAWMLDSIQLPSGGRIKVKYESDDYAWVQNRRATQMFKIAGFGKDTLGGHNEKLYNSSGDNLYIYVKVPYEVSSRQELYTRYLEGLGKIYFKLFVSMPPDRWGNGGEYVPCYADPDFAAGKWYGKVNAQMIWIKIKGVNKDGDGGGSQSQLALTAINYLRLNLPSKAYPGSEVATDLDVKEGVKILLSMAGNMITMLNGFNNTAKMYGWACKVDTSRSLIRLNAPRLKKLGGGLRVKSILIYDHWNAMTGKKESIYGQNYLYTTSYNINGVPTTVSSGVASWEPSMGGDENPFHLPIEYVNQASMLAPAASMYSEEPLGEAFYPGASIGYSKVRMRTVSAAKTRSANGYAETNFYTSYDFPTLWDWSMLDNSTKKRFKPLLSNFLRINARSFLTVSQGFKVELNDMNGKMRSQANYGETDPVHPISFTENFYRIDNHAVAVKHLNNIVTTIDPKGNIDTAATIGKDVELMTDMRDQTSTSIGGNINVNVDLFAAGVWPVVIPSLINLFQQETNQFRSAAMTKVIHRYGILDSVVSIDKGSKISSKYLLYDSETGEPLLTRTQNEFNDPVFQFSYPAHWVYEGMGGAYQNIGAYLKNVNIASGKITTPLSQPDSAYFSAGDELLAYSKQTIGTTSCVNKFATFPDTYKLWVIDTNVVRGGAKKLFLVDQFGTPFSGNDVSLKVTRSGKKNTSGTVGNITSLRSPLVKDQQGRYKLVFDTATRVITAGASEMAQYWKVEDKKKSDRLQDCVVTPSDSTRAAQEACNCLKPFFAYLINSGGLFVPKLFKQRVSSIIDRANSNGYPINVSNCALLQENYNKWFYSLTRASTASVYQAKIGDVVINIRSRSGFAVNFMELTSASCGAPGEVFFKKPGIVLPKPDTLTRRFIPDFSVNLLSNNMACPPFVDPGLTADSSSDRMIVENNLNIDGQPRNAVSLMRFDALRQLPSNAEILQARMILQADHRGHHPPQWPNANSVNPVDTLSVALTNRPGWFPNLSLDTLYYQSYFSDWHREVGVTTPFQSDTINVMDYLVKHLSGEYSSSSFMLTQGSRNLQGTWISDSASKKGLPGYLQEGYGNYYSTFYSQRYPDTSKRPAIEVTYVVPPPLVDTLGALLEYNGSVQCTDIAGRICYSAITDTTVNPYQYGILGNFRPTKSYVYYGQRQESDPTKPTNIRIQGAIRNFAPFWTFQGNRWLPSYDTTRWVWNSETTLFNRKGFELENRDPLGRYNAGIYGYGLTLPVAVVQNSRFQEAAFEGFEDYGFNTNSCDTGCVEARPFDFGALKSQFTTTQAHTGLYSLRVAENTTASVVVNVVGAADSINMRLSTSLSPDACFGNKLDGVRATKNTILPVFAPLAGKRMLVGGWVKEEGACNCTGYTNNFIVLTFVQGGATNSISLKPSGNLVEGWQRYEALVDFPADASKVTISLIASDTANTYFDDIRIHPYHAQMKSYVYNHINLRLMAELDENNYATIYEYDDDGTLVRLKKETERGIQTIKETRSALVKPVNE